MNPRNEITDTDQLATEGAAASHDPFANAVRLDLNDDTVDTGSAAASNVIRDPTLDAIFSALGLDSDYLDERQGPRARQNVAARVPESAAEGADGEAATDSRPWVLHVDDDPQLREIVRLRLQAQGIRVANAGDGTAGIREAFTQPVSAIILDFEMPSGQGDYVLGRLKSNPITRDIPVIILTGLKDKFLEKRLLSLGAACCLHKPPQFDRLIGELQKHICLPVA